MLAGQAGQNHGGDGDAEHPQGQLHQAIRVIQPGHTAIYQKRCQHRIQQQVDLRHRDPEHGRQHQFENAFHPGISPAPTRRRQQVNLTDKGELKHQLHHTSRQHPPGQGHHRRFQGGRDQHCRGNQANIKQNRGKRRYGEFAVAIQDAAQHGGEGNQQQIGKGQPQHVRRQTELFRHIMETGREQEGHHRGKRHTEQGHDHQNPAQRAQGVTHQQPNLRVLPLGSIFRQHRHKSLGKGPLREQPPKKIRYFEGHEKSIGTTPGAKQMGHHHIPRQPQHPGQHGKNAHHPRRTQQTALLLA